MTRLLPTGGSGLKLMGLADDRLQIATVRDNSDEGKCLLCYNFVSEEYWNNWTPPGREHPREANADDRLARLGRAEDQ